MLVKLFVLKSQQELMESFLVLLFDGENVSLINHLHLYLLLYVVS